MPWVGLQCVIVAFPDHTHLRFKYLSIDEMVQPDASSVVGPNEV